MIGLEYIVNLYNTQFKDIAETLGVSKQVVNGWIKGRYKISKKHLPKLSQIFNIPENYFQKELTELEKLEIQKLKLSNEVINYEYVDTITNEKGEETKITKVIREGVDISSLKYIDLQKKITIVEDDIKEIVNEKMEEKFAISFDAGICEGNDILNLYSKFNKVIKHGGIRIDVIDDILNGMIIYQEDATSKSLHKNSLNKKITKTIQKEQLIKNEEDKLLWKQQQEEFMQEQLNEYSGENSISEEEIEKNKTLSNLFK